MKIKVQGYLTFRKSIGAQVLDLGDENSITLRELLLKLPPASGLGDALQRAEGGHLGGELVVLVNGQHHSHLPGRLDASLKDGDEVAIFPPLAGG
jgi:molybdopterin converting factor small subunit